MVEPYFHGDGPLMKWVMAQAKSRVIEREDKRNFDRDLSRFRQARDNRKAHGILRHYIIAGGTKAELEIAERDTSRYQTSLTIGDIRLRETSGSRRELQLTIPALPETVTESLPGRKADDLISLPDGLQEVIAGRIIQDTGIFDRWLTVTFSIESW